MKDEKLIEALNGMLSQEHACTIRYATHAAVVTGPYADTVQARLKEISMDEASHAEKLRDRILALGGTPTLKVNEEDLKEAKTLQQILSVNMEEEKTAIRRYSEILGSIPASNAILFQAIQSILSDEQEHLEELESLGSSESLSREQPVAQIPVQQKNHHEWEEVRPNKHSRQDPMGKLNLSGVYKTLPQHGRRPHQ